MTILTTSRRLTLAGALLASTTLALPLGSHAATTAPAPKAPSVYTGDFVAVGTSSVTLKGGVDPHGLATVYAFQFGTTTGYGAQTAPVSVGNGTTEARVSQSITGLPPGAAFHYRLIATNAAGTANGRDAVFMTKKIPLTFKIAATPDPSVFGSSFSVSGVLSGTGAPGQGIALQASPFPYLSGFKATGATTVTDAGGRFSLHVAGAMLNTQFQVVTVGAPMVKSRALIERVAVRVGLHLRSTGRLGFVRMHGVVEPAVVGASVHFQLVRPGLRPLTVASTLVKSANASASRFSRVVRIRRGGLYRAIVQVDNGKQVPGHSRAVLIG